MERNNSKFKKSNNLSVNTIINPIMISFLFSLKKFIAFILIFITQFIFSQVYPNLTIISIKKQYFLNNIEGY